MNLDEFKQQNPAYASVPDDKLAKGLYEKYYKGKLSEEDFYKQINFKPPKESNEVTRVMSDINEEGIASSLGAPVDLANKALGLIGLGSDEPVGGSEFIKRVFRGVGASEKGLKPKTAIGQGVADVGKGATQALIGGGEIGLGTKAIGELLESPAIVKAGQVIAEPLANISAGAGGGAGGAIGKEAGKGTPLETPLEIGGEFIGGGVTGALRGGPSALIHPPKPDPVLDAYERLKLAPTAAEAGVGGRFAQWLQGNILPQTIGGGGVMERTRLKRRQQLHDLQQDIVQEYGAVKPRSEMGQGVQDSIMDTWNQVKDADGKLIGGMNKKYGGDTVYPQNLINALANPIGAAESKAISDLTIDPIVSRTRDGLRNMQSGGNMKFSDLVALKGAFGEALEPGFMKNVNDAQVGQLFSAVRKDMEDHIALQSPSDLHALQESKKRYGQAQEDFKQYFKKLVQSGNIKVSPERAYDIIKNSASQKGSGDIERFRHVWDTMPPTERGNLSATILARMGQKDPSNLGNLDTWELGKFLTDYRALSSEAKNILFSGKKDVRQSLDDLETVMNRIQTKITSLASTSKSGTGVMMVLGQFGLSEIVRGFGQGVSGILGAVGVGIGGPYMAAQMLTNPKAVKVLSHAVEYLESSLDAATRASLLLGVLPKAAAPNKKAPPQAQPAAPVQQ